MQQRTEIRHIECDDRELTYILTRKPVKNVNLRIKPDGRILVSANNRVSVAFIEAFIRQKQAFIIAALDKYAERDKMAEVPKRKKLELTAKQKEHVLKTFNEICADIYPMFQSYGVPYPVIRIRYMTSCWGVCRPEKGIVTLNTRLIFAPKACTEYVILHELAHFIYPNHSKQFWNLVTILMPDWKERKNKLERRAQEGEF